MTLEINPCILTLGDNMKKKIFKIFKIALKVLGVLLALALVAIIGLVIYFWPFLSSVDWSIVNSSNIKALYMAYTNDSDKLIEKEKQLDEKRADDIKNYVSVEVRDFTEDELKQIESGEKTKTQIIAQIIAENVASEESTEVNSQPGNQEDAQTEKPQEQPKPKTESADAIVARHIANLYAIQSEFEGRVNALAGSVKNWTHAYVKTQGVPWSEAKLEAVKHFTGSATAIENDCYARVDAEIAALESELKAIGADLSIVKTVRDSAYNEMEIKKAKIVQEGTAKVYGG